MKLDKVQSSNIMSKKDAYYICKKCNKSELKTVRFHHCNSKKEDIKNAPIT